MAEVKATKPIIKSNKPDYSIVYQNCSGCKSQKGRIDILGNHCTLKGKITVQNNKCMSRK